MARKRAFETVFQRMFMSVPHYGPTGGRGVRRLVAAPGWVAHSSNWQESPIVEIA